MLNTYCLGKNTTVFSLSTALPPQWSPSQHCLSSTILFPPSSLSSYCSPLFPDASATIWVIWFTVKPSLHDWLSCCCSPGLLLQYPRHPYLIVGLPAAWLLLIHPHVLLTWRQCNFFSTYIHTHIHTYTHTYIQAPKPFVQPNLQ